MRETEEGGRNCVCVSDKKKEVLFISVKIYLMPGIMAKRV